MFRSTILICLCLLSCTATTVLSWPRNSYIKQHSKEDSPPKNTINLEKRALVSLTAKGFLALRSLLDGAKPFPTQSKLFRMYKKSGNFQTAVKDFYSVKPTNVKIVQDKGYGRINQGKIYTGMVGDRSLRLAENGGKYGRLRPTLDIISEVPTRGKAVDKITYW